MLPQIQQQSIAELVAAHLREAIDSGALQSGQRLAEQEVCDQLTVSRTPVREAFRLLQAEGYLSYRPRYGVIVTELKVQDIEDIWEIRLHLEQLMAKKTAQALEEGDLEQILKALAQIQEALAEPFLDQRVFLELDEAYYQFFTQHCQNKRLAETANHLRMSSTLFRRKARYHEARARISLAEIATIYQAFSQQDGDKAAQALALHFTKTLEVIKEAISQATGNP